MTTNAITLKPCRQPSSINIYRHPADDLCAITTTTWMSLDDLTRLRDALTEIIDLRQTEEAA